MIGRRGLMKGLTALAVASPVVTRAGSLMRVAPTSRFYIRSVRCVLLPPILEDQAKMDELLKPGGPYIGPNGRIYQGLWHVISERGKEYFLDEVIHFEKWEMPERTVSA